MAHETFKVFLIFLIPLLFIAATWNYLNPITFWQKLVMLVTATIEFVAIFEVEVAILR